MNLPNKLTMMRVIMVPFFMVLFPVNWDLLLLEISGIQHRSLSFLSDV